MDKTFLANLEQVVGADGIVRDHGELLTYETDGLVKLRSKPGVAVLPTSADQVRRIVRLCHEQGVPFVARGQGTGLSGGAMPHPDGVLIVMTRMNRILEIDIPNRCITVEPGVMNLDVSKAVAGDGYYYAPDPSSQVICSIGGNVAENSGGAHCLKYGFTVHHVLGVEAVLPDGESIRLGGPALDAPGPGPARRPRRLGGHAGGGHARHPQAPAQAGPPCGRCWPRSTRPRPQATPYRASSARASSRPAVEMMDRVTIEAAEAAVHPDFPPVEAILIVELDGAEGRRHGALQPRRGGLHRGAGARDPGGPDRRAAGAVLAGPQGGLRGDGAASRRATTCRTASSRAPGCRRCWGRIRGLSERSGLKIGNVFHAGDGNLHPLVCYDERVAGQADLAHAVASEILTYLPRCRRVDYGGARRGRRQGRAPAEDVQRQRPRHDAAREVCIRSRQYLQPGQGVSDAAPVRGSARSVPQASGRGGPGLAERV